MTPAEVLIDIRPESINIDQKGVISLVIFGSDNFDVSQVILSSVRFAGVSIALTNQTYTDMDEDGHQDLLLHFQMTDDLRDALKEIHADLLEENYEGGATAKLKALIAVDGAFGDYEQEFIGDNDVALFLAGRSLKEFLESLGIN